MNSRYFSFDSIYFCDKRNMNLIYLRSRDFKPLDASLRIVTFAKVTAHKTSHNGEVHLTVRRVILLEKCKKCSMRRWIVPHNPIHGFEYGGGSWSGDCETNLAKTRTFLTNTYRPLSQDSTPPGERVFTRHRWMALATRLASARSSTLPWRAGWVTFTSSRSETKLSQKINFRGRKEEFWLNDRLN